MSIVLLLVTTALIIAGAFATASTLTLRRPLSGAPKALCSLFAELGAGFRALSDFVCAPFEPNLGDGPDVSAAAQIGRNFADPPEFAHAPQHPALLLQRLRHLEIDPVELVRQEPSIFRGLSMQCARCAETDRCGRDIVDVAPRFGSKPWLEYCPNAPTLGMIATWAGMRPLQMTPKDRATAPRSSFE